MAADGSIVIDVLLDDGSVVKGVANIGDKVKGLGDSGEKASLGIGKIVTALGLVGLASKGINMVKQSLDGAIKRYDTLNAFPRVMQQMGFDATESKAAIDKLSAGIDGLPTALDDIASKTQRIAIMTGDLDGAVNTTLALNNAFLASGASTADAERGLDQYVQMLAKGEVDLQSWRTLQETMGLSLNEVAKAFGFTGKSAQNDLYAALKKGNITFDQFNDKMIEMSNKTGGFADIARESSGGIKTSWTNMKTAIVKGLADVIGAVDKALGGVGSIEGLLDKAKEGVKKTFKAIVEAIPEVVDKIQTVYNALEPWMPLIGAVALATVGMVAAWSTFNSVKGIIDNVKMSFQALNLVIKANPWLLTVGAIIAAAVLVYTHWEPIKEFFIDLWGSIKKISISVWDAIKEAWSSAVQFFVGVWDTVTEFFSTLWAGIVNIATSIWDTVVAKWNEVTGLVMTIFSPIINFFSELWSTVATATTSIWDNTVNMLSTVWNSIQTIASAAWEIIKNVILGPILLLINLASGDMEEFGSNLAAIWNNIKNAGERIWQALKDAFIAIIKATIDNMVARWNLLKDSLSIIWNGIKSLASTVWNAISQTIMDIMDKIKSGIDSVWKFIEKLWMTVLKAIATAVGVDFDSIKNNIQAVMDAVKSNIDAAWNFIKNSFKNVLAFLKALVKGDFEGMKTAIKSQMNNIKTTINTIWNNVKTIFSNVIEALKTIVRQKFDDMKNSVKTKMDEVKTNIENGWNKSKTFLTSIDLLQIGKDIIQGLINGIKGKVEEVKAAVKDVADAITGKIKSILNIHSPSRVMKQIGEWTGQGLAEGIASTKRSNQEAIAGVGKVIIDATKKNEAEVTKIADKAEKDRTAIQQEYAKKRSELARKTTSSSQAALKTHKNKKGKIVTTGADKVYKIRQDASAKLIKLNEDEQKKLERINNKAWDDMQKKEAEASKQRLEAVKLFIQDKKSLEQLSLVDEAAVWEKSVTLFKDGTKEKVEAQKAYKTAVEAVNKEITSINQDYSDKMQKINDDLKKQEEDLTKAYEKSLDDRTKALLSFANTFDAVNIELKRTGQELMGNLESQVDAFKKWQEEFGKLSERGIDKDLLDELSGLGVKALPELVALNSMTDEQLTKYSELYREKSQLARQQAEKELEGMKKDTDTKILELRQIADGQLSKLQTEWMLKIKNLTATTASELSTLRQIGVDAGQGLLDGLVSMEGPLIDKATQIADSIKSAMQSALDIHSPSRWMRDFIAGNMAKGFSAGVDKNKGLLTQSAKRFSDFIKPDFVNSLRGVKLNMGLSREKSMQSIYNNANTHYNVDRSQTMHNQITVRSQDEKSDYERVMRRMAFELGL